MRRKVQGREGSTVEGSSEILRTMGVLEGREGGKETRGIVCC